MIKGENIICFGFADWDNPYKTNQHHIMSRLSAHNKVLFIESLGLRKPTAQRKDVKRMFERLWSFMKGPRLLNLDLNLNLGVIVYSPLVLPYHSFRLIRAFNKWFLRLQIDHLVFRFRLSSPILWSYVPNAVEFLGRWHEKLSVYHCVDDLSANPRIDTKSLIETENRFLQKVSLVFTTAKALYEEKKKANPHTYYLPNVADYDHFHKAVETGLALPSDVSVLPKPIIGFIGAISEYKLDFQLIAEIAKRHPEWSIVLIGVTGEGEKSADLGILQQHKNIHILGGRPYSEISAYLKSFNVCILPNKINDYTKNMFPMKFYEYLAAGKPVVATALPALDEQADLYYRSNNPDEFNKNLQLALAEKDSVLLEKRFAAAKQNTWEVRIESMSKIIEGITNAG